MKITARSWYAGDVYKNAPFDDVFEMVVISSFMLLAAAFNRDKLVRETASNFCPYTNFCHMNASKVVMRKGAMPCCSPCFCEDDCYSFGNCCLDKIEPLNKPPLNNLTCKDSFVKRLGYAQPARKYRIVDSCPVSKELTYLSKKCRDDNTTDLEDFIWVSDDNGMIYQNVHCAMCNNINNTISWQIQTTCKDILRSHFKNIRETLASENCELLIYVPEHLRTKARKYECFDAFPNSKCNETGQWTYYDSDIATACEQTTWPFFHIRGRTEKNIFCYLCNKKQDEPFDELCVDPYAIDRTFIRRYSFLIDYERISMDETPTPASTCNMNEILDKVFDRCRELVCPFGTAPFYGKCKFLFSVIGMVISVIYRIDIVQSQTEVIVDDDRGSYHRNIGEAFVKRLYDSRVIQRPCQLCTSELRKGHNNETSHLFVTIKIKLSIKCAFDMATEKPMEIIGNTFKLRIKKSNTVTLLVHLEKRPYKTFLADTVFLAHVMSGTSCMGAAFRVETEAICPALEIGYSELSTLSVNNHQSKTLLDAVLDEKKTNNINSSVYICVDQYTTLMSKIYGPNSGSQNDKQRASYIAVLIVSVILRHKISNLD